LNNDLFKAVVGIVG